MKPRHPSRVVGALAASCIAALAVACGNYHPNRIEFRFTPVPATVKVYPNKYAPPTPLAFFRTKANINAAECEATAADDLTVTLDMRKQKGFEQWLDDIGFNVRRKYEFPANATFVANTSYDIGVPLGSVPDALPLIREQPGVLEANAILFQNGLLLTGNDEATREAFFGCQPPQ